MGPGTTLPASTKAPDAHGVPVMVDANGKTYVEPNPFVRAAFAVEESFGDTTSQLVAGTTIAVSNIAVPAFGFARGYAMLVEATGGVAGGTNAVTSADGPWNAIADITVVDTNSKPVIGPFTGYDLMLLNKWLPSNEAVDPASSPVYSAIAASGNFTFLLYLMHEIGIRDGLGCLPNQNASSPYRISYTIAAPATIYATSPGTTLPAVRVRFLLLAFSPPDAVDARGVPNMTEPPADGTTMKMSKSVMDVVSGDNTLRFTRMGALIRGLILVNRTGAGVRADNFPDPFRIEFDNKNLIVGIKSVLKDRMWRRSGYTLDTGVYVIDYISDLDGRLGAEQRDQWLPTTTATRLELRGSFGAAGTLAVLTQDVAPTGNVFT